MQKTVVLAKIPVALEFPPEMGSAITEVLSVEYEPGYFGEQLTILDIGANVGSFALWANMRWPHSKIHAYEPCPETFQMLIENTRGLSNVRCQNFAVYPSHRAQEPFYREYPGDGEAGLADCMVKTFEVLPNDKICFVSVIKPSDLPNADIIKIDVEGAETDILKCMDLGEVSLILLEYQFLDNKTAIKETLKADFALEYEDAFEWRAILPNSKYRKDLEGDYYGRLFFVNHRLNQFGKLVKLRS